MAEILRRVLNRDSLTGDREERAAEAGPPLLLLGTSGSGKTALLFATALEVAGEGRGPVLFLTRRPLQSLPVGTRASLDPLRLQKIRFHYPPSTRELLRLLCSAHETQGPAPSLLLLDGLEEYLLDDLGSQEATYLTALLLDTVAHFSRRQGPGQGCGLLVALKTQEEADSSDYLQVAMLRRYFPAQCWLQPDAGPGEHRLRVCLELGGLSPRAEWCVTFQPQGEMKITP
ncbi:ATPase SWSAP1 [Perognathus longimembris pacificus]|uniref:ATPase SWSAP1 n=1 Tax=Perognathus longimembris pacificus TaxID=214514 RepID=UPI002018900F|nr:ATPase SWSAP1 [Perognathus longimembris pacificus]